MSYELVRETDSREIPVRPAGIHLEREKEQLYNTKTTTAPELNGFRLQSRHDFVWEHDQG